MKTFVKTVPILFFAWSASAKISGGHDGNGGDTYLSQIRESFVIASEIMKKTDHIQGASEKTNRIFLEYRNRWVQRLESKPDVTESTSPLIVDELEKAAIADPSRGSIQINLRYWQARPVSMVQSIVLAIHETGHLENVPLTHRELDEVGFALVQQNLKNYFGSNGLQKISEKHKSLAPREKVMMLFEDADAPATLDDFGFNFSATRLRSCIVYPPKQDVLYSMSAWFYKEELVLAPDSPLFPGGQKQVILLSTFRENYGGYSPKPTHHKMEQTAKSLNVTFWGEVTMDGDRYQDWAWLRYEFRKNGNLIFFKMTINDSNPASYGYCWDKK